jgi:hypothetical protein
MMCEGCQAVRAWEQTVAAAWDQQTAALAGQDPDGGRTSQNGWPVNPPRTKRIVPGTDTGIVVADGPAGDVLMYVASQFDKRVEDIDGGQLDDWGWADRPVRDSSDTSNHASATAIDLNATRHGLGAAGTFPQEKVDEIHRILEEAGGVIRWGGDYTGRKDEMHFEINASQEEVAAAAERLRQQEQNQPRPGPRPV